MKLNFTYLPGDGIGPEVGAASMDVLKAISDTYGHELAPEIILLAERPLMRA